MSKKVFMVLTVAFGLLSGAPAADAIVSSSAELGLSTFNRTDSKDCTGCVAEASGSFGTPPIAFSASGIARASAEHGTLRAFAKIEAFGEHTGFVINVAKASASFQDTFFINSVALNGLPGTVNIPIAFNWNVTGASAYPPGTALQAINQFNVGFFGPSGNVMQAMRFREDFDNGGSMGTGASSQIGSVFSIVPFTFRPTISLNFVFGQAIKVGSTLDILLSVKDFNTSGITSLFGIDDAGNSAYWGGFESVLDASGSPVLDYTLAAVSGVDWTRSTIPAVPEPSSIVLMLAGLATILVMASRMRKS